ncbi:Phage lysis protein, holin [compost metagenome]
MDKASLTRTIILALALTNQMLTAAGKSPLPIEDETVDVAISTGFTIVVSIWTWWKNNYISKKGQKQKEVLENHNLK